MSKEAIHRVHHRTHEKGKNNQYFVPYVPNPNSKRIFPGPNAERSFVTGAETIRRKKRKHKK